MLPDHPRVREIEAERQARPIGRNCAVSLLRNGARHVIAFPNADPNGQGTRYDAPYFGEVPFQVIRQNGRPDQVIVSLVQDEESRITDDAITALLWIPSTLIVPGFSLGGTPDTLTITMGANILDTGVNPIDPTLDYSVCDALTLCRVEFDIDSGGHNWAATSFPDWSALTDPAPYDIVVSSPSMVTTIRFKLLIDATNLLLYEVLYTFQFALTGSDPVSTTVVYVYPGSWYA